MRHLLVMKEKNLSIKENKIIFELVSANKVIAKTRDFVFIEEFFSTQELVVCENIKRMIEELTGENYEEEFI